VQSAHSASVVESFWLSKTPIIRLNSKSLDHSSDFFLQSFSVDHGRQRRLKSQINVADIRNSRSALSFTRKTIFSQGVLLAFFQLGSMALAFARNIVLARLLSIEDMAVASLFAMIIGAIELVSEAGLSRFIVQSPDGNSDELVSTAHCVSVIRSALTSVSLLLLAYPLSMLLSAQYAISGFLAIALVPLIRGFNHLDCFRQQRKLNFFPSSLADFLSQLAAFIAALAFGFLLEDYRAGYLVLFAQYLTGLMVSHAVASGRYSLGFFKEHFQSISRFALPLAVNGCLIVATIYGDRLILASCQDLFPNSGVTLKDVGVYSVSFSLVFTLGMGLFRIINSLALPILSKVQSDRIAFQNAFQRVGLVIGGLSGCVFLFAALLGGVTVRMCFGEQYDPGIQLMIWIAFSQSLRVLRTVWNLASLAVGDSQALLFANIGRSISIPLSFFGVYMGWGILGIVTCAALGELISCGISVCILVRKRSFRWIDSLVPALVYSAIVSVGFVVLFFLNRA
jgi:O-antigen/teichoic acid export membrane protein